MKILLIQLARFGDILQTVPTLRAVRRTNPQAEIHVLVRSTFQDAGTALTDATALWQFNTEAVLRPLLAYPINFTDSTSYVEKLAQDLRDYGFDKIVNLSFSPMSSFLCSFLDPEAKITSGYTRHSDGFLNIPDDASAYFYAQVGLGRTNRVHICDIFAQVAGVELIPEDYFCEVPAKNTLKFPENSVVIHVGASQKSKAFESNQWVEVIKGIFDSSDLSVVLVGSAGEAEIAQEIQLAIESSRLTNFVGKTQFGDLFDLVTRAEMLIASDSALMNVANLVGTQCLNLSSSAVNYWETGPRSKGSRILYAKTMAEIIPRDVVLDCLSMIRGEDTLCCEAESVFSVPAYRELKPFEAGIAWQLVQAIYMGGDFPAASNERMIMGMMQLREVLSVIIEQINQIIKNKEPKIHASIIDRSEAIILRIKNLCPELSPLIRWYETEKIRIKPGEVAILAKKTHKICHSLDHVLSLYLGPANNSSEGVFDEKSPI